MAAVRRRLHAGVGRPGMGKGGVWVLGCALVAGCFGGKEPPPVVMPPPTHEANRCDGDPRPIDPSSRERLLQLERRLVASVLLDGRCVDDGLSPEVCTMTADLHRMLRRYPDVEMVFLFPEPVAMPASPYWAHMGTTTAAIQKSDHPVFFLELSHVSAVGSSKRGALVANVFSGPTGTAPSNVIWLWGGYGERCFVPRADGTWAHYMIGTQAISQQPDRDPPEPGDGLASASRRR